MDMVKIEPTRLVGTVTVPPSKSMAHRVLIAGFLSGESARVEGVISSGDMTATLGCIKVLGGLCKFSKRDRLVDLLGRREIKRRPRLDCGESGSTLRFFIPIALALVGKATFVGRGRLMERPLEPYFKIFRDFSIDYTLENGVLTIDGRLKAGRFVIDGGVSSQFITGLLFALPLLEGDSVIEIDGNLESKGYIDMTLAVLKDFGIEIECLDYKRFSIKGGQKYITRDYIVEGDYSQAAFFLVAGALGGDITCLGLDDKSIQGDREVLDIIRRAGAEVSSQNGGVKVISSGRLNPLLIDASEIPDLVPILAVLLCFCNGESKIINAGRLRIKESDRLHAIVSELKRLGADIEEGSDYIKIRGTQVLCGNTVSAWNDHRIAMAMAIAACRSEGKTMITGALEAVKKSYPDFFEDYKALGGNVR